MVLKGNIIDVTVYFNSLSGLFHLDKCLYAKRCKHCTVMPLSEAAEKGRMCYICQEDLLNNPVREY